MSAVAATDAVKTTEQLNTSSEDESVTEWTTVHRVVFPIDADVDTYPLYVDLKSAGVGGGVVSGEANTVASDDLFVDRRSVQLSVQQRVSFATYFNAFPASYWRQWTSVEQVRLTVSVDNPATVLVYRSNARGSGIQVHSKQVSAGSIEFDLPLDKFGDGGWYWFDVISAEQPVIVSDASWSVPTPKDFQHKTASVTITTFNRPVDCVKHMQEFANAPELLEVLDQVIVVDQGTKLVRETKGYDEAAEKLGDKFTLIKQGNLGGSGGFSRGMYEAAYNIGSDYVLLLDDDVIVESEGVLRAINFAEFTRQPTIVGGHMFNLYERSVLHSFGEEINEYIFEWGPAPHVNPSHDFGVSNLRTTPWMHRRIDVAYNGWWMCLIPTQIVKEIGLSLPVFIKWDDAEFSLRAAEAGYRTVSLPGAAIWHMPWIDKDDTIDWQAYYHQRNRWLVALLHSPYKNGGGYIKQSLLADIRFLVSMQYSVVELRLNALEDLLSGADHLHREIGTKQADIRAIRQQFQDAAIKKDPTAFPAAKRIKPLKKGLRPREPHGPKETFSRALKGALKQFTPLRAKALQQPEERLAALDTKWWWLSQLDSAVVSTADGSGAAWYVRNPKLYQSLLGRTIAIHQKLFRRWDELAEHYKAALGDITSIEEWTRTFEDNSEPDSSAKNTK